LGRLALLFNIPMVRVTRRNIAYCLGHLPPPEQARLVRASVLETARLAVESTVIWRCERATLDPLIKAVHGREHVEEAKAAGRGVIILAPHLGNWEVLGRYLDRLGEMTLMFQPQKLPKVSDYIKAGRGRFGATLVATDRRGLAQMVAALRKGGLSGVLPDQTPRDDNSGLLAPFFNRPAFTMTLVCKLIQNTGCGAVFGYAKRVPGGFEIYFNRAPAGLFSEDLAEAVAALNQGVSEAVLQVPEQYQWEYKRFKHNGEKTLYDNLV
ncbi:MAG TPA: lysophospholipid acyltransferase family protein, partial [Marinagarivorans sp.]|nr:lysophospholipid acyltransferase family protein [Marinagarivorans sp.]